jgi:hypothetical protein
LTIEDGSLITTTTFTSCSCRRSSLIARFCCPPRTYNVVHQ